MLIQFSVGNYRSFSKVQTLSMEATSITEFPENIYKSNRLKLLLGAAIYGANSSGKSNYIRAMGMMKNLILKSFLQSSSSSIPYDPFLLNTTDHHQPSFFEMVFVIENIKYRYGFEVNALQVLGEWLFETEKKKERPLFVRENDGIEVFPRFQEGINLESRTRNNALFLSVVDQFNGQKAGKILNWLNAFNVIDGISHRGYRAITFEMLEDENMKNILTTFYRQLDLGFDNIKVHKETFNPHQIATKLPEEILKQVISDLDGSTLYSLLSFHQVFDKNDGRLVHLKEFDVREKESSGTNKLIDISGPLFHTLQNGGVLVVDELDAKLHPLLTMAIIRLFQNTNTNNKNAQLIFATHNTNILNLGRLRRDQIYFTEKDRFGGSDLYSLVEYNLKGKKVRKDNSFEKDYLRGRYGAIPFIENLYNLQLKWQENEK